ncbi:MAG: hypothetical protein WC620_02635 [Methanoregula sp.]|jgi:hypothetical protein
MADFTQRTNVKSAVRKLADPITNETAFNTIVQSVITGNPFGCISYMMAGANHQPVEKSKESYTAKFLYQDEDAKTVGNGSESYNTIAGFTAGIAAVVANTANNTAHGGNVIHDADRDSYSVTLKCHDPSGELYFVTISRQQVAVFSYENDAIRTRIETWADGVTALN